MNTADILDKAADLIDTRGFAKRRLVTKAGCLCSAGAMYAAAGMQPVPGVVDPEHWSTFDEFRALEVVAAYDWFGEWLRRSGINVTDAVQWNDRKARTKEEVVSTLRAAAQAARAES